MTPPCWAAAHDVRWIALERLNQSTTHFTELVRVNKERDPEGGALLDEWERTARACRAACKTLRDAARKVS